MDVINDVVSSDDLQRFEHMYNKELKEDCLRKETKFNYAWCLVKSKYPADIIKGISFFEELIREGHDGRDCLYYLALGNARLKEYAKALMYCRQFLEIEPLNEQVKQLMEIIQHKMNQEGTIGIAIATGFGVVLSLAVAVGVALAKR